MMTSPDRGNLEALKIDRGPVRRQRRSFPWLVFLLGLGLAGGGVAWWKLQAGRPEVGTATVKAAPEERGGSGEASGGGEPGAGRSPQAEPGQVLLNASGYVTARRAATVSAKVTGKVMEVLVEEGMKVAAGEIVARLDDSNAVAALRLAEARLEAARRTLEETRPSLDFAELELARFIRLRTSNAASQSDIARAESEVAALKARQIRQTADIGVAEAQVAELKQQVDDTIIRTSFGGVITTKDAQPGEIVSPMSAGGGFTRTGICTVVDMTSLEIEVDVSESYLNRVQPGQPCEAMLDAYADWRIPCRVTAIIPTADRQKATVKVRVAFDTLDSRILPDMGVKVAFLATPAATPKAGTAAAPAAPEAAADKTGEPSPRRIVRQTVVPARALTGEPGSQAVWVFRGGKTERRAVRAARISQDKAFIASGLSVGEKVVITPAAGLTDGGAARENPKLSED